MQVATYIVRQNALKSQKINAKQNIKKLSGIYADFLIPIFFKPNVVII